MRAQLIPLDGGPLWEIDKDLVVVGRRKGCDIRLAPKCISKQHCVLVRTDGLLLLRDLGSTNGCKVNGRRVRRAFVLPNDILAFSKLEFRVHLFREDLQTSGNEAESNHPRSATSLSEDSRAEGADSDVSRSDLSRSDEADTHLQGG